MKPQFKESLETGNVLSSIFFIYIKELKVKQQQRLSSTQKKKDKKAVPKAAPVYHKCQALNAKKLEARNHQLICFRENYMNKINNSDMVAQESMLMHT